MYFCQCTPDQPRMGQTNLLFNYLFSWKQTHREKLFLWHLQNNWKPHEKASSWRFTALFCRPKESCIYGAERKGSFWCFSATHQASKCLELNSSPDPTWNPPPVTPGVSVPMKWTCLTGMMVRDIKQPPYQPIHQFFCVFLWGYHNNRHPHWAFHPKWSTNTANCILQGSNDVNAKLRLHSRKSQ